VDGLARRARRADFRPANGTVVGARIPAALRTRLPVEDGPRVGGDLARARAHFRRLYAAARAPVGAGRPRHARVGVAVAAVSVLGHHGVSPVRGGDLRLCLRKHSHVAGSGRSCTGHAALSQGRAVSAGDLAALDRCPVFRSVARRTPRCGDHRVGRGHCAGAGRHGFVGTGSRAQHRHLWPDGVRTSPRILGTDADSGANLGRMGDLVHGARAVHLLRRR
jgi:hypothetical protein